MPGEPLVISTGSNRGDYVSDANPLPMKFGQGASAGTNRSITATTTSQTLMAANTARKGFFIKNDAAVDVWINYAGAASAVAGAGNMKILANGGYYESPGNFPPSSAITIIAASATPAITAWEY